MRKRKIITFMIIIVLIASGCTKEKFTDNTYEEYKTFLDYSFKEYDIKESNYDVYSRDAILIPAYDRGMQWKIEYKDIDGNKRWFTFNNMESFEETLLAYVETRLDDEVRLGFETLNYSIQETSKSSDEITTYKMQLKLGIRQEKKQAILTSLFDETSGVKLNRLYGEYFVDNFDVQLVVGYDDLIVQHNTDLYKEAKANIEVLVRDMNNTYGSYQVIGILDTNEITEPNNYRYQVFYYDKENKKYTWTNYGRYLEEQDIIENGGQTIVKKLITKDGEVTYNDITARWSDKADEYVISQEDVSSFIRSFDQYSVTSSYKEETGVKISYYNEDGSTVEERYLTINFDTEEGKLYLNDEDIYRLETIDEETKYIALSKLNEILNANIHYDKDQRAIVIEDSEILSE